MSALEGAANLLRTQASTSRGLHGPHVRQHRQPSTIPEAKTGAPTSCPRSSATTASQPKRTKAKTRAAQEAWHPFDCGATPLRAQVDDVESEGTSGCPTTSGKMTTTYCQSKERYDNNILPIQREVSGRHIPYQLCEQTRTRLQWGNWLVPDRHPETQAAECDAT